MITYSKRISFPLALLLKEKFGFNEPSVYYWEHENEDDKEVKLKKLFVKSDDAKEEFDYAARNSQLEKNQYSAPSISDVFEWLQDKGFWVTVDNNAKRDEEEREFSWLVTNTNAQTREFKNYEEGLYKTFEEAAEDGIRRALYILYLLED